LAIAEPVQMWWRTWIKPRYALKADPSLRVPSTARGGAGLDFRLQAIDPRIALHLYARVAKYDERERHLHELPGVFKSADGGNTWEKFTDRVGSSDRVRLGRTESVIGISAANAQILFGGGEGGGVRSQDGGKAWAAVGQAEQLQKRPQYRIEQTRGGQTLLGAPATIEVYQFVFDREDANAR